MSSVKGGITALRLSKRIDESWVSAPCVLKKTRMDIAHHDGIYRPETLIEFNETPKRAEFHLEPLFLIFFTKIL
jgi:hypothetical protein